MINGQVNTCFSKQKLLGHSYCSMEIPTRKFHHSKPVPTEYDPCDAKYLISFPDIFEPFKEKLRI